MDWVFSQRSPCILAIKSCSTSDYGDRTICSYEDTRIFVNPELPEAHQLAEWIQKIDRSLLHF